MCTPLWTYLPNSSPIAAKQGGPTSPTPSSPATFPKSSITYSTPFTNVLASFPPFLVETLQKVGNPTPVPTKFLTKYREGGFYSQGKFGHFVLAVEEALGAPGVMVEWNLWIATQWAGRRGGTVSPIVSRLLPAVLDALKATLDDVPDTPAGKLRKLARKNLDRIITELREFNSRPGSTVMPVARPTSITRRAPPLASVEYCTGVLELQVDVARLRIGPQTAKVQANVLIAGA